MEIFIVHCFFNQAYIECIEIINRYRYEQELPVQFHKMKKHSQYLHKLLFFYPDICLHQLFSCHQHMQFNFSLTVKVKLYCTSLGLSFFLLLHIQKVFFYVLPNTHTLALIISGSFRFFLQKTFILNVLVLTTFFKGGILLNIQKICCSSTYQVQFLKHFYFLIIIFAYSSIFCRSTTSKIDCNMHSILSKR